MSANMAPPPGQGDDFADIAGAPPPGAVAPQAELVGSDLLGEGRTLPYGGTFSGEPFLQPDGSMTGPLALRPGATGHTYYEGNQYDILKGLNTEDLVRVQQQLAAVGLASKPLYGELDDGTIGAFTKLLAMSNRSGTSWDATLTRLSTNPLITDEEGGKQAFDVPTYLAPDVATLAQDVKAMFRQRLNREPDQLEMAALTAELAGWHKGSFDAQVGVQRQDFENRQTEGEQSGGTARQVDPVARFMEAFESRYANELDFVEDKEEAIETRETVEQGVGTLSQMSGA